MERNLILTDPVDDTREISFKKRIYGKYAPLFVPFKAVTVILNGSLNLLYLIYFTYIL